MSERACVCVISGPASRRRGGCCVVAPAARGLLLNVRKEGEPARGQKAAALTIRPSLGEGAP